MFMCELHESVEGLYSTKFASEICLCICIHVVFVSFLRLYGAGPRLVFYRNFISEEG